jgi:hypothetical protein
MALVPIKIPPGVYRNGTELQASGRWYDSNLVRWHNGTIRPVGGWRIRNSTATDGFPRTTLAWRSNDGSRRLGVGTNTKLYSMTSAGTLVDITPAGFVPGAANGSDNTGYGNLAYGSYAYGTPRPDISPITEAATWSLDTWGEYLVACSTSDGKLYEWQLDDVAPVTAAAQITNSPTNCVGLTVTDERSIFALGANGNPRKVAWCDLEDNTVWTAASTNQAGSFTLTTSGKIMCARRVRGQILVLTDIDAHVANYVGLPFTYQFETAGRNCGIISRQAVAVLDNMTIWMGNRGFFVYDGYVKPLASDVEDYIFSDLNGTQRSKIVCVPNTEFGEIWWFYPSSSSVENDRYVVYNYQEGHWAIGQMPRTCGTDKGVFNYPMMWTPEGYVYDHEVAFVRPGGGAVYAETGPVQIGEGDRILHINELIPDERTQGDVTATFFKKYYPNGVESTYGPYTLNNPTSVRFNGRQISMRIDGARNVDWRVGIMRLNGISGGRR